LLEVLFKKWVDELEILGVRFGPHATHGPVDLAAFGGFGRSLIGGGILSYEGSGLIFKFLLLDIGKFRG
jgi:hypothetical protein